MPAELAKLLDETIGTEWRKDATKLETLNFPYDIVREKLDKIKIDNKTFKCLPTKKSKGITERKILFTISKSNVCEYKNVNK